MMMQKTAKHPRVEHSTFSKRWMTAANICLYVSVSLALGSLTFFMIGLLSVKNAIVNLL
jgi:hypothetical protein